MNHDEFLIELWERVKPFVPRKDRLEAAEAIITVCDEHGYADGLESATDIDKVLNTAIKAYFELDDQDEEEDW